MKVEHVLLDADGVLQRHPGRLLDVVRRVAGSGVDERLVAARRGRRLATWLHETIWLDIAADPDVVAVVTGLRAAGTRVHLATNQQPARAAHMREVLGYGDVFDTCWYSGDLGVAKPDPEYFRRVVAGLGVEAGRCLLLDDRTPNVRAAREVGLAAERWTTAQGQPALRAALARHGLHPAP